MDCTRLITYRADLYACFTHCADVLMNTADALLTATTARSFPELSLSPGFTRRWPSLYQGVEDGRLDRDALRRLFVASLPVDPPGDLLLGIDASSIYRPYAQTSADRTPQYVHNLSGSARPVRAGWSFSTLVVLPPVPSSSTYLLDNTRIESGQTAADVALDQLRAILPRLQARRPEGERPRVVGDRYYSNAPFLRSLHQLDVDGLFRIQGHRRLYRAAPPPRGGPGRPRLDGALFQGKDPATHGTPDACFSGTDEKGRPFEVRAWKALHFRVAREVSLWVYEVTRPRSAGTKRDPKKSGFVSVGRPLSPEAVPPTYARRFSQEHGYKFDKGALLWNKPPLRTPVQFQLWTDLVAAVHNEILLARPIVQEQRLPWETLARPATPQQVRRGVAGILPQLGTPASVCQPRGKAPGRPAGSIVPPARRFPVVRKHSRNGASPARPRPKPTASPSDPTSTGPWVPPPWLLHQIRHVPLVVQTSMKQPRLKAVTIPPGEDRVPLDLEKYAIRDGDATYDWVRRYLTNETKRRLDGFDRSRPFTEEEKRMIRDDLRSYEQRSLQNSRRQPKTE